MKNIFKKSKAINPDQSAMTSEDFAQLDQLLSKLHTYLGSRYCIVPGFVHDGYHIGLYNSKGDHTESFISYSLQDTAKKALNRKDP